MSELQVTCDVCNGTGLVDGNTCQICAGSGTIAPYGVYSRSDSKIIDLQSRVEDIEDSLSASIIIHPWFYTAIIQGTYTTPMSDNHIWNVHIYNDSHNDGDQLDYTTLLRAGTYTFRLITVDSGAYGIVKMLIDDVEKASVDTYSGTPTYNNSHLTTGIVVAATGIKTISLKVDGKNVSSSDHYMNIEGMVFHKTA